MKGKLTIFYSFANHIKNVEMMYEKASMDKQRNVYIHPNGCEFNIDEALQKLPDLVVLETIAHINTENQRHYYRYQDIEELLNAGIDVYTTLNVYQIESLQDHVTNIMGSPSKETIPDYFFDQADDVIFVDVEVKESREMMALKELALRRLADRISNRSSYSQVEHILACLSSSPSNAKIIRTASRMANAFNSKFTAVFVQTPDFQETTKDNKNRLVYHQKLAHQLGAKVETVFGDDIPFQIAEYARLSGVTKIVLGQSATKQKILFHKPSFAQQLINYAPHIDVHIIPDDVPTEYQRKLNKQTDVLLNVLKSGGILVIATLLSILFDYLGFTDANIIMVYILGVLLTSVVTTNRIYSLVSSIASVFIFNFLFTVPRFSLAAYATGYPVTFIVMFLTAFITGTFANRYKEQARQSARNAYRSQILFDTNQLLSKAKTKDEIIGACADQILKLLGRDIVLFSVENDVLSKPMLYSKSNLNIMEIDKKEEKVSFWVYKNNHQAGATTSTMSDAKYLYLAIRTNDTVYGVIGIDAKANPLDASENSMLLSILGECALALENEKNVREKEETTLLVQSEQLRSNLLRAISHDLRTPLTSISGNASILLTKSCSFDEQTKQALYKDIYDDSVWLINLVENLLSSTRFEDGRMKLKTSPELLGDIIDEAMSHFKHRANTHTIIYKESTELLLVDVDAKLIIQVIVNILDNAIKYTPINSEIVITTSRNNNFAYVSIADNGLGISEEEKAKIFDKFYCGENKIIDNRRSLGLGLYLCKAIVEAHRGYIDVKNHVPHGSVFTFSLPLEEVATYE